MGRSFRNSFNSGVLDPKLASRIDLDQWRSGLRTGTNVFLLPHGGVRKRPGLKFIRTVEEQGRMARFKFNREQQYLLHFRDEIVDVFNPSGGLLTRVVTPYATTELPDLYLKAQTADTMVVFHEDHAPHRLLRAALRATNPIRTFSGSPLVRVYHVDHDLLDGDQIGLSGLTGTIGGIVAATHLNKQHEVIRVDGTLGSNPLRVDGTTNTKVWVDLGASSLNAEVGDRITLAGLDPLGAIPADQLNRTQTITDVDSDEVAFSVESGGTTSATGGGSAGAYAFASFYEIDVGTNATSSATGGGSDGRAWVFHSLAPNAENANEIDKRRVTLSKLPQFDFEDSSSPAPKKEIQRLTFNGFGDGDSYKLIVSVPTRVVGRGSGQRRLPGTIETPFLDWDTTAANNATIMQDAINQFSGTPEVLVEVELEEVSLGNYKYLFKFTDPVDVDEIQVFRIRGAGTIVPETLVEGGTREEDVISSVRGWPRGGIFYQRRLWMWGLKSRPSTLLASEIEDFFSFDTGSALDSEAIDATGEFDPILHLIAERSLFCLTTGTELEITGGGDGSAISPSNINLQVANRYGANDVVPVSVAGRPMYVDRTGRCIRQLSFSDTTAGFESKETSILSQHLINDPQVMDVWRNDDGDYLFVVNADGTAAVLNINLDQGVAGWTKCVTDGSFLDVCEVGDELFVVVERDIDGDDVLFMERFDYDFFTDCAVQASLSDETTISGLDHLDGETVAVRADGVTMERVEVASGDAAIRSGDVPIESSEVEAGLPFTATVEPMPPQVGEFTAVVRAAVDLYESRAVNVDGYRLRDYLPGQTVPASGLTPAITGVRPIELRGWGDRQSITITSSEPQPLLVRAVEMETA